jgi:ABC-2 type transport system ATP-binding protein
MDQSINVIEVKQVKKSFKKVQAVKGVDLSIEQGEFVALLGPNGAGKTTLVEMIEGIQKPDEGEILITGKHWHNHKDELHKILGISLQETRFIDKITVVETMRLFASFFNLPFDHVDEIIRLVNLEDKKSSYVVNLSGGQRQRLTLGIAILNNPQILLLDEPTTGLDPTSRHEIWTILMNLKKKGTTSMILTTHYMEEAEYLCDRIIILDHGRILAQGSLEELITANNAHEIIEFSLHQKFSEKPMAFETFGTLDWDEKTQKGKLLVENIVEILPHFLSLIKQRQYTLETLLCRRMTLDDLFLSLTGRSLTA